MSTPRLTAMDLSAPPIVRTMQNRSLIIGIAFSAITIIGAFFRPQEFFRAYLLAYMCWLGVTLGCMAILMIRHLTGGAWGYVVRRLQGAAMRCVPLMTLLFVPLLFSFSRLYIWAWPLSSVKDQHLRAHLQQIESSYLNVPGFIWRAVIYFAIWNLLSFFLTKWSRQQDHPPVVDRSHRFKALSAAGLILYAFSISFAAIDWVMSLDPSWISTIYGLIILIGQLLSAMCFTVVIEKILAKYRPMSELLKDDYVHDHGKWILAFIMVWAYFSFSQLLIIWAGNLPEEITWYTRRLNGGWQWVGLALAAFQFALPFLVLLSRPLKRNLGRLVWVAVFLLIMRFVDLFWIIEPNFSVTFNITWLDVVIPIAMGGIWLAYFFRNLKSMPLLAVYDVHAVEVLEQRHE